MAIHAKRRFLVCYDVADPKRLGKVHRRVSALALPVQYSVYLFHGTPEQLDSLLDELSQIIDPAEDDVRVYPVPACLELAMGGRGLAAPDIFLVGTDVAGFATDAISS